MIWTAFWIAVWLIILFVIGWLVLVILGLWADSRPIKVTREPLSREAVAAILRREHEQGRERRRQWRSKVWVWLWHGRNLRNP